jgi:Platelet-activating factor acetylhydrolase, isoform II
MTLYWKACGFFALAAICFLCHTAVATTPETDSTKSPALGALPPPTGPFAVGKTTVHWTDQSRVEPLSPNHEPRELMVDIWYPAEPSNAAPANYLDAAAYERAMSIGGFQNFFREASDTLRQGVKTHDFASAPYARSAEQSPVLIFSPGGGMVREVYAAQLEDLASHGYVIAAISHPYDAIVTLFPDGRHVAYSDKRWPTTPSVEGEANLNQLEWHANDIRFVLDELTRANLASSSALPFAGHLDLSHVGAFGHSFGGIAAAHACQLDRRFKACLNEDGVVAKRPLFLDARGWAMDQAFMLILHDPPTRPLTDEQIAQMKMPRQRVEALVRRLDADQEAALQNAGKGSYRVRLQSEKVAHMDFSDLPLLGAHDRSDAGKRAAILTTVRSYVLAFFDQYLRGVNSELLNETAPQNEFVDGMQRFEPAQFPCRTQ